MPLSRPMTVSNHMRSGRIGERKFNLLLFYELVRNVWMKVHHKIILGKRTSQCVTAGPQP